MEAQSRRVDQREIQRCTKMGTPDGNCRRDPDQYTVRAYTEYRSSMKDVQQRQRQRQQCRVPRKGQRRLCTTATQRVPPGGPENGLHPTMQRRMARQLLVVPRRKANLQHLEHLQQLQHLISRALFPTLPSDALHQPHEAMWVDTCQLALPYHVQAPHGRPAKESRQLLVAQLQLRLQLQLQLGPAEVRLQPRRSAQPSSAVPARIR